ncbi:MAG: S8 family serine peptidase [Xanthomonadaceae bacterium]|nr:S8 family serine peptidase [Xanthomonadaceae bacterium]
MSKPKVLGILLGFLSAITPTHADLVNGDKLTETFQLQGWHQAITCKTQSIKVAVLDNGFSGFKPGMASLPSSTVLVEGAVNAQADTGHGLAMAEILWSTMGKYAQVEMTLINTNGFSNFKNAITYVIENKIDIVLYSQVWSFGGNFNGKGLINALVTRATSAGIVWINAAGNFGSRVYDQVLSHALHEEPTFFVQKGDQPITITLSWNDFSDNEQEATDQDLDFQVVNHSDEVVGESVLRQNGAIVARGTKGVSGYAREKLVMKEVVPGEYRIKIKKISNNFNLRSRVRILIESAPEALMFASATPDREIFPPADHPAVLTIGEDSLLSSRSMASIPPNKPDLVLPIFGAKILGSEIPVRGSSVSAAIFSGVVAMMKVLKPSITRNQISKFLKSRTPVVQYDPGLIEQSSSEIPSSWRGLFRPEMKLTKSITTGQYVVLTPYEPKDLLFTVPAECRRTQSPWAPQLWRAIDVQEFLSSK